MKLPFWATTLTICGIAVLCSLGVWQYQRLQWKAELLAQIDAQYAIDASRKSLSAQDFESDAFFVRGYLEGQYLHDKEIHIQPRTHKGLPGYHILTPFEFSGGVILVNRGWIPIEQERQPDFKVKRPSAPIKIVGLLRRIEPANSFVPNNKPEKDVWYRIDFDEIAEKQNIEFVSDKILYIEDDEHDDGYPLSAAVELRPNNNHAQYMVFWFTMAFVLAVMYLLRFIKRN